MDENYKIADLTTYIDPSKSLTTYSHKRLDAQNFGTNCLRHNSSEGKGVK